MFMSTLMRAAAFSLTIILIFTSISCSGGGGATKSTASSPVSLTGAQAQLITNVAAATGEAERTAALQKVVAAGYSLGITDVKGNQLNTNVAPDAVSLASGDIAALNYLTAEGQGRTIGSVVDYLAGAGVVLTSTKKLITFNDFLPDLQKYINWSFQNPKDPKAVLGLLLSSGTDMKTPVLPPVFTENTLISPTASIMMLADILLGVQAPARPSSRSLFRKAVYAADIKETASAIQGLLTLIEPVLEKNGISIPEYAKKLIASFAAGNNFAVRIVDTLSLANRNPVVVRQIQLGAQKGQTKTLAVVVVLVPSGEILQEIPVNFSINLLSSASGGGGAAANLYPDADAILYTEGVRASMELNGHRMGIVGKEPGTPAAFALVRGLAENKEPRTALLYAMATINAPDLGLILKKYSEILEKMGEKSIMLEASLPMEKVVELYQTMQQGLKISASICKVTLSPKAGVVSIDPAAIEGEIGQEYTFTAKLDPPKSATVFLFKDMLPTDTLPSSGAPGVEQADTKKVKWDRAGAYSVSAGAYFKDDQGNWILVSSATAKVNIKSKTSKLSISFQVGGTFSTLESLSFSGKTSEPKWPGNIEWVWDWGDGTAKYVTANSPNASHRYIKPGKYSVLFSVRDGPTKEELGSFQYDVVISDLNILQTMKTLTINAWGYYTEEFGAMKNGVFAKQGSSGIYTAKGGGNSAFTWPLTWKGYNCSGEYIEKLATGQTRTWKIDGVLSTDTMTLLSATFSVDYLDPNYQGTGKYWRTHAKLIIKDVPLTNNRSLVTFWGKVEGASVPASFVSYEYESILQDGRGTAGDKVERFVNFDWNNTSQGVPKIQAEFKKE